MLLDRNVAIPGQTIYFALALEENLKDAEGRFPQVNVFLSDLNARQIERKSYSPTQGNIFGQMTFSSDLQPGNYVLHANIYDTEVKRVLIEISTVVYLVASGDNASYQEMHIKKEFTYADVNFALLAVKEDCGPNGKVTDALSLDAIVDGKSNAWCYRQFADTKSGAKFLFAEMNVPQQIEPKTIEVRAEYCLNSKFDLLSCFAISSVDNFYSHRTLYYESSNANYQYEPGVSYKISAETTLPGFFHNNAGKFYPLKRNGRDKIYVLKPPIIYGNNTCQFIDLISNKILKDVVEDWPSPLWSTALQFSPISSQAFGSEMLYKQNEKSNLVDNIYHGALINANKVFPLAQNEKIASDIIKLSLFQPFESIELFITEAMPQMRILKDRQGNKSVKMTNLDSRTSYEDAPSLLINGVLQESSDAIFNIPINQIDSLSLYRQLDKTRKTLGSLARNGVIEVHTKPGFELESNPEKFTVYSMNEEFPFNNLVYDAKDPKPYLNQTQYIGPRIVNKVCIQHNDHLGVFLFQAITPEGIQTMNYKVNAQSIE